MKSWGKYWWLWLLILAGVAWILFSTWNTLCKCFLFGTKVKKMAAPAGAKTFSVCAPASAATCCGTGSGGGAAGCQCNPTLI